MSVHLINFRVFFVVFNLDNFQAIQFKTDEIDLKKAGIPLKKKTFFQFMNKKKKTF